MATIKFHYTLFIDGKQIESSKGKEPLEFEVGAHQIIPGLEKELVKMKKGEKKSIDVRAKEAYGEFDEKLVNKTAKAAFGSQEIQAGGQFIMKHKETGQHFQGVIKEIIGDEVTVDFNHPLAGKDLRFDVEIV